MNMNSKLLMRFVAFVAAVFVVFLTGLTSFGQLAGEGTKPRSEVLVNALKPFVDRGELPGAVVLVASRDRILAFETIGNYDSETKQAYEAGALFNTHSQVKTLTALGVMMLVEGGKIRLDDPVDKYLPEFRDLRIWRMVKEKGVDRLRLTKPLNRLLVRHALGHTDGLNGIALTEKSMPRLRQFPKAEVDQLSVWGQLSTVNPLVAEPGTFYKYDLTGPLTAGRLIEVVSGMPYTTFLRRRILEPLSMKATVDWLVAQTRPVHPASGLHITAQDNARFGQMLLNEGVLEGKRFISEKSLKQMRTMRKAPPTGDGANYPFGLVINDDHRFSTGGAGGTWMWIDTKHGLVMVFMTARRTNGDKIGESHKAFLEAAIAQFGESGRYQESKETRGH